MQNKENSKRNRCYRDKNKDLGRCSQVILKVNVWGWGGDWVLRGHGEIILNLLQTHFMALFSNLATH